jgi:hypothetical protein
MTLTRECEEANLTSPGSMPAGFLAPSTGWGCKPDVPACTKSRKSGKVATRAAVASCGGRRGVHINACWCSFRMRVQAPHRLLAIAG